MPLLSRKISKLPFQFLSLTTRFASSLWLDRRWWWWRQCHRPPRIVAQICQRTWHRLVLCQCHCQTHFLESLENWEWPGSGCKWLVLEKPPSPEPCGRKTEPVNFGILIEWSKSKKHYSWKNYYVICSSNRIQFCSTLRLHKAKNNEIPCYPLPRNIFQMLNDQAYSRCQSATILNKVFL